MGDHLVVSVDPLITPASLQSLHDADAQLSFNDGSSSQIADIPASAIHVIEAGECETMEEEEHLIRIVECRICQEEDSLQNLDIPCACSGTLKFAHRRCVQLWCNEKGDTICEICHQPYQPGYTAPSPLYHPEDTSIDIREGWTISGTPLDLRDPRILAIAAVERHVLEAEHDDYVYTGISGTTFCRSVALILMTLLLVRHAASLFDADVEKALAYSSFFLFRAAAFILPCYLMAQTIRIIQSRRQRQQAAAEFAFMLHAEQHQGLQFATSAGPAFH